MVLQNKSDGCESRFIQEIVKVVVGNLNRAVLSVALHPVGIDSRVDIMAIYDRHNGLVSLQNEIEEMLDHVRRIKSGGDLDSFKIDQIERHEMDLRLLRTFVKLQSLINQKLSRTRNYQKYFSHHLHSLLMYLKNKKLENILYNIIDENIDVAIDFLLVFLDVDVSNHVNNDKDETSSTGDIYSMRELEKPKDLKALVKSYYKSLKFTPSQFHRTSGGLRFLDSLLNVALKPYYVVEPSKSLPSQHCNPVGDDDDIVGFDIATEKVIRHPTRGTSELDVIPIVEIGE
ncbi:hypothetical protein CQW23_32862 [Capsicum baccatum]|uniref:Uncharacterized protein n=1 Tax=Capsicum baccatum TaxID=33114 RepID=A0A2G2V3H9_CAPBA|nr:hypothetical protein CQW23_32862 [Capsicum baccatum]